jgi:hypothetical protein
MSFSDKKSFLSPAVFSYFIKPLLFVWEAKKKLNKKIEGFTK